MIPAFSGNGLAMRAGRNLQALAGEFTVHLLVVAMYGGQEGEPEEEVIRLCASWRRILAPVPAAKKWRWSLFNFLKWGQGRLPAEWSGWTARNEKEAAAYFAETKCERLWVFRFYLLPWARAWLDGGGEAWLDIDEMESGARESQAGLLSLAGEKTAAARLRGDAGLYRGLEERHLRRFGRIVTASELEAERVAAKLQEEAVVTWPNVVAIPDGVPGASKDSGDSVWRLLFVGSLGHFPNREAIHFAAREVLPRLQALIPQPVVLCVAGAGADAHREAFRGLPHVEWLGTVADLGPTYAMADLVLVPLRAGGGTRIKILEAFAHGKPVVSTHTGAEGLRGLERGRELLLADDPAEIAAACADLFYDAQKREALAANGRACVAERYSPANLGALAAALRGEMDATRAGSRGRE
ncbi:MAG: glycosyltransferase family 4 protein [Chthoniobacteraceae bacterium]